MAGANAVELGLIGYQAPLTRFETQGERSRVVVPGIPLRASVWLARDTVGAYVATSARVRDTPVSVRRMDLVCVRAEDAGDGRAAVLVRTSLRDGVSFDPDPALVLQAGGQQTWLGTYPQSGLLGAEPVRGAGESGGEAVWFAGSDSGGRFELFAAPDGPRVLVVDSAVHMLATLVRVDGPWRAVRLGDGPYVVGYTRATPVERNDREAMRAQAVAQAQAAMAESGISPNARFENARASDTRPAVPAILRTREAVPVVRHIRAGAQVRLANGETFTMARSTPARIEQDDGPQVRVLAAVQPAVALHVSVAATDLSAP
ncbi:MAG: hypothetical protein R3B40_20060 [Polyangiales bacterium]